MLVGHGKPLDDVGEDTFAAHSRLLHPLELRARIFIEIILLFLLALVGRDQARNNFICNIFSGGMQHIFELLGREALDNHILLFFSQLVFLLELLQLDLLSLAVGAEAGLGNAWLHVVGLL